MSFSFEFIPGRPEKLPDVCYSWWVLASLKIIGKLHWIDKVNNNNNSINLKNKQTLLFFGKCLFKMIINLIRNFGPSAVVIEVFLLSRQLV